MIKFEPLGRVDGHQHHHITLGIVAVKVRDEGDLLQKPGEAGLGAALVGIGAHAGDQLAHVLQPVGPALFVLLEHGLVAGQLQHLLGKQVKRQGVVRLAEGLIDAIKAMQCPSGPAQGGVVGRVLAHLQHPHPQPGGDLGDPVQGGRADLAGGLVDDPAQPQVVPRVCHDGHVGQHVPNFLAVIKALAAHDLVGDARPSEVGLDGAGLGVHPVEHRVAAQRDAPLPVRGDGLGQKGGLVLLAGGLVVQHLVALAVLGPEGLALAAGVVLDDAVGGVEDAAGRAVVLL